MRKPNYNQERMQRERDKAAKAQAKAQKKQEQRAMAPEQPLDEEGREAQGHQEEGR